MRQISEGVTEMRNEVEALVQYKSKVTFCDIRQIMLRSPIINHNHVFRPDLHIQVSLGDLGYIDSQPGERPTFVCLENVLDKLGQGISMDPLTTMTTEPVQDVNAIMHPNGASRYCPSCRLMCILLMKVSATALHHRNMRKCASLGVVCLCKTTMPPGII
jgi:hypothetical protein